jgi:hypothetical protein
MLWNRLTWYVIKHTPSFHSVPCCCCCCRCFCCFEPVCARNRKGDGTVRTQQQFSNFVYDSYAFFGCSFHKWNGEGGSFVLSLTRVLQHDNSRSLGRILNKSDIKSLHRMFFGRLEFLESRHPGVYIHKGVNAVLLNITSN